jgi:hypothetical protein
VEKELESQGKLGKSEVTKLRLLIFSFYQASKSISKAVANIQLVA